MKLKWVFVTLMAITSPAMATPATAQDLGDISCDFSVVGISGDIEGESMAMKHERLPVDQGPVDSMGTMSYDGSAYARIRAQGGQAIVSIYIDEKETVVTRMAIDHLSGETIPKTIGEIEYQIECSSKN